MRPALQLAILWLIEDYPLLWFSYLTFGERRKNAAGQTYIVPTPFSSTPAALKIVKANLHEFAKIITFIFAPTNCEEREKRAWERNNGLFMFACVLGHEIEHGYNFFMNGLGEPLWSASEKQIELGFSWGMNVLVHILMTRMNGRLNEETTAIQVREILSLAERNRVIRNLKDGSKAQLTARDGH
jgi:hypothetical protein